MDKSLSVFKVFDELATEIYYGFNFRSVLLSTEVTDDELSTLDGIVQKARKHREANERAYATIQAKKTAETVKITKS